MKKTEIKQKKMAEGNKAKLKWEKPRLFNLNINETNQQTGIANDGGEGSVTSP